jgi:ATP-dependent Clp protease adaptor protein ClpS
MSSADGSPETSESDPSGALAVEDDSDIKPPKKYAVILHNDDYSTMDFVIEVLEGFFNKNRAEATAIMFKVHQEGRGVAGIYSHEIAETKASQVTQYARKKGFPLRCTYEPLDEEK